MLTLLKFVFALKEYAESDLEVTESKYVLDKLKDCGLKDADIMFLGLGYLITDED